MPQRFIFDSSILSSVVGGHSAIDIPKLNIHTLDAASAFLLSYGFDINEKSDVEKLSYYHRRALVLMIEKLGFNEAEIPDIFRDLKQLGDIRNLLIYASTQDSDQVQMQRWACAIIRCMHVFVHAENDLFSSFSEEIQSQILTPFQDCILHDGNTHRTVLKDPAGELDSIELLGFEVKPFKTSSSTVIKLLAKPDALAMKIFDKLGVRFITRNLFDTFQVVRFLIKQNVISFPHIMPDQSSNNLYPVEVFMQVCDDLSHRLDTLDEKSIQDAFDQKLAEMGDGVKFLRKENFFSGEDYRFIKFISRKLIHIKPQGSKEAFSFFYPFEVQIMDQSAHQRILSGPSEHQAYKERQRIAARKRLFPELS
ncbi:TIGR04552 family protein [Bdellovibrio svalbardensis]|uniref:TIGR04552 family protein n=1 Tax=Bdellovibrio svalbardensis TaxID=2972972 RepID=A0ABT6DQ75_9BACT|nr:TIGR04552 family protein [Bdellovibrio svalbardensis]MDG0818210.1 TIGR04552 family protein [Bdellovibrio svalbardensis]